MTLATIQGEQDRFFDELQIWSERKHRILAQYMSSYVSKRGSTKSRIYYVDGYAGTGSYGTAAPYKDGSPVIVAKLAKQIQDENRKYRLHCFNTEINPVHFDKLQESLAFVDSSVVTSYCGDFNHHLSKILEKLADCPAVFFIDPYGIVGIAPSDLKSVAQRYDTEILLTLSLPTLFRMSGSMNSFAPEAAGKVAQVSRVLGEDPGNPYPEWAQKKDELDTDEWATWAAQRYMDQIQKLNPDLRYGLAYPIRQKFESGTKYFLIFATRSMDAFPFMTDFICSQEDALQLEAEIENRQHGQLSMFAPRHELVREEQFPSVIEEIYQYGLDHQGCTRKEIIEQFSLRHLGKFMQKHFRYMVGQLVQSGKASIYDGPNKHKDLDRRPISFM